VAEDFDLIWFFKGVLLEHISEGQDGEK